MIILILTLLHNSRSFLAFNLFTPHSRGCVPLLSPWFCQLLPVDFQVQILQCISKQSCQPLGLADPQALYFSRSHFSGSSCCSNIKWELTWGSHPLTLELSLWCFHGSVPWRHHQPWSVSMIYKPRSDVESSCLRWAISIIKCTFKRPA